VAALAFGASAEDTTPPPADGSGFQRPPVGHGAKEQSSDQQYADEQAGITEQLDFITISLKKDGLANWAQTNSRLVYK